MVQFLDLPPELVPTVLSHLLKPHHLASTCLVSRTFYQFAAPLLYERPSIYPWQREGKAKVIQLFSTLAHCHHLARYVVRLEIGYFPKAFSADGLEMLDVVLKGLKNCINLRACKWTRDGSLNSDIVRALQTSDALRELEINGRDDGNYDPDLLKEFTSLTRISLVMPSGSVISRLKPWTELTGDTLQTLKLICKVSIPFYDSCTAIVLLEFRVRL